MCLYPRLIKNRKYTANKKNGGNVPEIKDPRTLWVPVGCQKCIECKKQKARAWSIRLQEEIRTNKTGKFVTMTFSNESIAEIIKEVTKGAEGYEIDNEIATIAVRRFLERWRKKHGRSVKHWLVTELGQGKNAQWQGTENLHLHGIIFTEDKKEIRKMWQYGFVYLGDYVSEKTVNYMTKYTSKVDPLHKEYNAKILTSPGIGAKYTERHDAKTNKYKPGETDETYYTRTGEKINLPIYYRNKIYTEDEREKLWLEKLDKEERYVLGRKISTKNGPEEYYAVLAEAQAKNKRLGYGDNEKNWSQINYENERRKINIQKRLDKAEEKANFKQKLKLIEQWEQTQKGQNSSKRVK